MANEPETPQEQGLKASTGWVKKLFQLIVLLLVAWGVWQSIRRSVEQLGQRQAELHVQADALRAQAQTAATDAERHDLERQAEQLVGQARDFWRAEPAGLVLAGLCYALAMIPPSLFWRRCLMALEQADDLLDIVWGYFYGNLGKYLPGKAMVIVLRVAALQRHGVKKTATSITVFMETLTYMAVGGATAAVSLIFLNIDWRLTLLAGGLLVGTMLPVSPPVLRIVLPRLQKGVAPAQMDVWTSRITWRLFFQGWLMMCASWLANGLSLMLVLKSLPSSELGQQSQLILYISCCGACGLAVVLGFFSLLPGGAGVREVVISTVLIPVVGPIAALCGALWLRITWLVTELALVGLLAAIRNVHTPARRTGLSEGAS